MDQNDHKVRGLSRRKLLTLLGVACTHLLTGLLSRRSEAADIKTTSRSCVVTPTQTEGPYFVDERLRRSDIRADPSTGLIADGVPLLLQLSVSALGNNGCTPLAGAVVDIWHCDASGVYSDVRDPDLNTIGKKFLRGYQITDSNGDVRFTTIYPGWYEGRAVHIHFKVRTAGKAAQAYEFTSQFYFDDSLTDQVHARPPYVSRGQRAVKNERDGIFRRSGSRLMLPLVENGQGYGAKFAVAFQLD
jgi:protocatechuate 3,4-dioxygenase beta subunit